MFPVLHFKLKLRPTLNKVSLSLEPIRKCLIDYRESHDLSDSFLVLFWSKEPYLSSGRFDSFQEFSGEVFFPLIYFQGCLLTVSDRSIFLTSCTWEEYRPWTFSSLNLTLRGEYSTVYFTFTQLRLRFFLSHVVGIQPWYGEAGRAACFLERLRRWSHTCGYPPSQWITSKNCHLDPQFQMGHGSMHSGYGCLQVEPASDDCSVKQLQVLTQNLHFQASQYLTKT